MAENGFDRLERQVVSIGASLARSDVTRGGSLDADIVCHENSWTCSQIFLVVHLLL